MEYPVQTRKNFPGRGVMMRRGFLVLLVLAAWGGDAAEAPKHPTMQPDGAGRPVREIAADYRNFRKMTDQAVFVNPELAMLCIGASQSQVEAARKTKGPHAHTAILIYMNESAAKTFERAHGDYETGAVIVKEKMLLGYREENSRAHPGAKAGNGVGGMVKREKGYDPEHGDWEYFYFDEPAKIESGRMGSCVTCHEGAKATDHVFGSWADAAKKN